MRRGWLALWLVCACGDDAEPSDSELGLDASVQPRLDAAVPTMDAEAAVEQVRLDGGDPLPSYAECRGTLQSLHAANVGGRSFSSAIALNQIYVAYAVATCGGSAEDHFAEGLALVSTPTSGVPGEPVPLINTADCVRTSVPTLQTVRGALNVYYASNQGGSPQVYLHDDAGTHQLSTGSGPAPVDMAVNRTRLFYARANAVYAQQLGSAPQTLVASDEGYAIDRIAASELGASLSMIAWTSQAASAQGVFLRVIDQTSTTPTAPQTVGALGPQSGIALATQSQRGAVVFSDDQGSLFLRTVELDHSLGQPVRLTSGNQFVSDVAVARYGIGYTIAFRSTPMTSGAAVIRLLMVDELGNAAKPRVISEARSDGRGIEVRVANDGRVIVVWAEPGDGDTLIRIARLDCI